jgi:CRP/FNR family transcriptional regulator, dissimilatory nitrate respiration regulator
MSSRIAYLTYIKSPAQYYYSGISHFYWRPMPEKLASHLSHTPLFSDMTEKDCLAVLNVGKQRMIEADAALFTQGDPANYFYIITKGSFQIARTTREGREKTVDILTVGQTLGDAEILSNCKNYRANSVAISDASVVEFSRNWLMCSARSNETFALNLLSAISQRLHMSEMEAEHKATMSAAQLVACFLQRLSILYGLNPAQFELPYPKTLIASRLGMAPETFSRTLATLKKNGIEITGSQVRIHDIIQVERFVCDHCSVSGECPTHQRVVQTMARATS